MNTLLDYFFPITSIIPTPDASVAFLKKVLVVVKPKVGATEDTITECINMTQVGALTDNLESQQLFAAGMSKIYVVAKDDLILATILNGKSSQFYTVLVSSDYSDAEIDAMTIGDFSGVVATSSTDDAKNATRAALENRVAFHSTSTNKAKNMFYAFGKLLSNTLGWLNQQYITVPFADDVDTKGEADILFDDKVSFVITDEQYGNRLGLFAVGGKAIIAPYLIKNFQLDLQSAGLQYISGNQPQYTVKHATLLEESLQQVADSYIERGLLEAATVEVKLEQGNFVASGYINVSEPTALWRIFGQMKQTL